MAQFVPEKRIFPLDNPPQEKSQPAGYLSCPYCPFITKFTESLKRHVSRFHERELAGGGDKSPREGGERNKLIQEALLRNGYVRCKWWTVPCPTAINPLMRRVCQHTNECPEGGYK